MKLKDKIQSDIKSSMINKDVHKLSLLRVVKGEIETESKRTNKDLSDDDVIRILRKMRDNAELMDNQIEIKILNEYLPIMLGENQIKIIIAGLINKHKFVDIRDMGKVMIEIKKLPMSAQIDNKIAIEIIKKILV